MSMRSIRVIAALVSFAGAAPVPTEPQYINWHSEPSTRGTWSLLFGCITTLFLCVYTAVHLNVPAPGTTLKQQNLQVAKWVFIGIFAPEVVVYSAVTQWMAARDLSRRVKVIEDKWKANRPAWLETWTLRQSFFIGMGGLALAPTVADPAEQSYDNTRRVLTAPGFLHFLRSNHPLPDLSADNISDYSKANSITKAISVLQALWLIVQLIGRWADSLTVTELEINTLAHVFSALLMFLFWFRKPVRIDRPLSVSTTGLWAFHLAHVKHGGAWGEFLNLYLHEAYFDTRCASSPTARTSRRISTASKEVDPTQTAARTQGSEDSKQQIPDITKERLANDAADPRCEVDDSSRPSLHAAPREDEITSVLQRSEACEKVSDREGDYAEDDIISERQSMGSDGLECDYVVKIYGCTDATPEEELSAQIFDLLPLSGPGIRMAFIHDLERPAAREAHNSDSSKPLLSLNVAEIPPFIELLQDERLNSILDLDLDHDVKHCARCVTLPPKQYARNRYRKMKQYVVGVKHGVSASAENWVYPPSNKFSVRKLLALCTATVFYGAIHAAAWNSHFPSVAEMWLWRASSIMAGLFIVVPILLSLLLIGDLIFPGLGTLLIGVPGYFFGCLALLLYCFTRVFLVVEAFISLRSQPPDVYLQPNWLGLLPHL